jgi:hypothetical protein
MNKETNIEQLMLELAFVWEQKTLGAICFRTFN